MSSQRPFASIVQAILIGLLLVSFVLIAQRSSIEIYQIGLGVLIISTFLQIVFGNIPPATPFRPTIIYLVIGLAVVAVIFFAAIQLVPSLINLGR